MIPEQTEIVGQLTIQPILEKPIDFKITKYGMLKPPGV